MSTSEAIGNITVERFTEKWEGVTCNILGTGSKTGTLFYFNTSEQGYNSNLTWYDSIVANQVYYIAVGGGGWGGSGSGISGGGGGGGGDAARGDFSTLSLSSPVNFGVSDVNAVTKTKIAYIEYYSGITASGGNGGSGGGGGDGGNGGSSDSNGYGGYDESFSVTFSGGLNATMYFGAGGGGGGGGDNANGGRGGGGEIGNNSSGLGLGGDPGQLGPNGAHIEPFYTLGALFAEGGLYGNGSASNGGGGGGGANGFGGGGGGGGVGSGGGGMGNRGADGAIFIFIVGPTPSAPGAPTLVTATSNSLSVLGNPTGVTGSPFTQATFYLDGSQNAIVDTSNNYPDASGNGLDSSGNYHYTYTGLTATTSYDITWALSNSGGLGPDSSGVSFSTLQYPPAAPGVLELESKTSSTITVFGNTTGVSGSPFTSAKFYLDGSENAIVDVSGNGIDASGNVYYTYIELNSVTNYNVSWALSNSGGLGPDSSGVSFLTLAGGNPTCFLHGSKILCLNEGLKEEYIAIEDIRAGTPVKTLKGTYVRVHTIGKTIFNNPDNADRGPNRLFKLTPQRYPELTEDLIITGCHSILVDKLEHKQKTRHLQLMDSLYMTTGKFRLMAFIDEKAEPYLNSGDHEIWHFALENDEPTCNYGVYANGGLLVETASIKNMTERSGLVLIK